MPSLDDAVAQIRASGLPVLFIDTCCLLDVIRAPRRPTELRGCIEAAVELHDLATTSPSRCTLVVASLVPREWREHAGPVAEDLRGYLEQVDRQTERLHQTCDLVGITPTFPRSAYKLLDLADRLYDLSQRLLDSALRLDSDDECKLRAWERASSKRPPSRKGGEVQDSTIIEECLEVSRRLGAAGSAGKRVFCTSNTGDYCEAGSSLHPLLVDEFGAAGLGFAANLPWAVHEVKNP